MIVQLIENSEKVEEVAKIAKIVKAGSAGSARGKMLLLRGIAVIAAVVVWLPAGAVSAHFARLVRSAVQIGMLPRYPSTTVFFDSCATLRMNRMPDFCERVYKLPAPDPTLAAAYSSQVAQSGWELVDYRAAQGYDWYARRTMKLECFKFRTWVWGINDALIVAVFDERVIFLASTGNMNYCNRYLRF